MLPFLLIFVKRYFFTVEHDDEFTAWSQAFAGACPELSHDPNMSYFTIRGVIDLSYTVLDDKNVCGEENWDGAGPVRGECRA